MFTCWAEPTPYDFIYIIREYIHLNPEFKKSQFEGNLDSKKNPIGNKSRFKIKI